MAVKIPRLAGVLGARFEDLDRQHLLAMCAERVAEDVDLDFKQQNAYVRNADSLDELAKDVTAMANARGGLIVIGVAEDAQGCAHQLMPVDIDDRVVVQLSNALRSRVFPFLPPDFSIRTIPDNPGTPQVGFILIGTPRSPMAPHAVRPIGGSKGQPRYSYARRMGRITAWLDESEIAQLYRDRFRVAEDQAQRVHRVLTEGAAWATPPQAGEVRLELALAPSGLAERRVDRAFIQEVTGFLASSSREGSCPGRALPRQLLGRMPEVRRGRMHVEQGGTHAVWHTDSSAYIAIPVARVAETGEGETPQYKTGSLMTEGAPASIGTISEVAASDRSTIDVAVRGPDVTQSFAAPVHSQDLELPSDSAVPHLNLTLLEARVLSALHLIASYAHWADGFGDVDILARTTGETTVYVDRTPTNGTARFVPPPVPFTGAPSEPCRHVAYLSGLLDDSRQLRALARNIASDLLADYGVYELTLLRPDGGIRTARLAPTERAELEAWLASNP